MMTTTAKLLILSCVLLSALLCYGMPLCLLSAEEQVKKDAMDFLTQYGYLPLPLYTPGEPDMRDYSGAICEFQKFYGLPQTCVLDEATKAYMNKPRCGLPDVGNFVLSFNKWSSNDLKYRIDIYTPDLSIETVQKDIRDAWKVWADVTPLTFTEVGAGEQADLVIKFQGGNHGDGYPFDSAGGVLAHAFFPSSGKCHFDEAETWTSGVSSGINLFIVAVHEFGHALGLQHSDVAGAVMLPYYQGYQGSNFKLGSDDILGIQTLYGPPPPTMPTPSGPGSGGSDSGSGGSGSGSGGSGSGSGGSGSGSGSSGSDSGSGGSGSGSGGSGSGPGGSGSDSGSGGSGSDSGSGGSGSGSGGSGSGSGGSGSGSGTGGSGSGSGSPARPPSGACSGDFQTVVKTSDGTLYGFTDGYVWDLTNRLASGKSSVSGTTSIFSSALNTGSGPQAAVTVDGKTYIFSGCNVWRFDNTRYESVDPIRDVFRGLPCQIDAAFKADDDMTYFFLGKYVYVFQDFTFSHWDEISDLLWNNFPTSIDAITASGNANNDVYIFSGTQYWKWKQSTKTIYSGYPRRTVSNWLSNCPITV